MAFDLFSSKKSSTTNTTNYNDSSANAGGENSVAVGSGANLQTASNGGIVTGGGSVHVETSDPETVARSLAFAAASDRETTNRYLATLNTLKSDREIAAQQQYDTETTARRVIEASNNIAASLVGRPYESDTAKLAGADTITNVGKYVAIAAVSIVVIIGGFMLATRKK